jgi:hypothetical protein
MAAKPKKPATTPRYPEKKWGLFHGGLSVCVWTNEVENDDGKRFFRSITISPRRYLDPKTGEWQDAGSQRPADLPSLILALEAAHDFTSSTSLPGQPAEGDEHADATVPASDKIPF